MKTSKELRTFTVYRSVDAGGVSGTGRIMDGVIFHNGWVVVCWRTDIEGAKHGHTSIGTYPSWETFRYLHIDSHPDNRSVITFGDNPKLAKKLALKIKR